MAFLLTESAFVDRLVAGAQNFLPFNLMILSFKLASSEIDRANGINYFHY